MNEELKNKFDDFDPGVSDGHVDMRWEAIRPLLPAEDGPRGIIFFSRSDTKRILAVAAVLLLVSFVTVLFLRKERTDQVTSVSDQKTTVRESPLVPLQSEIRSQSNSSAEVSVSKRPSNTFEKAGSLKPGHENSNTGIIEPEPVKASHKDQNGNEQLKPLIAGKGGEENENEPLLTGSENEVAPATNPLDENKDEITLNETPAFLSPIQFSLTGNNEHETRSALTEVRPRFQKPSGKWTLELFAGVDRYNNSYNEDRRVLQNFAALKADPNEGASETYMKGYTYMAGVAAHRSIGRRLFIPLQGVYSGNQNVYNYERSGYIKVTQPVMSTAADSTEKYRQFTEVLEIKLQKSIRVGLGLGVRLFAAPMFTLNAMVLGELNQSNYVRTNEVTFTGREISVQTNTSTGQIIGGMTSNLSQGYDPNSSDSFTKNNYAAVGTIHAARRMARRMAITARLSYYYNLRQTELQGKYSSISFRPRDLMLSMGVNYAW